MPLTLDTPDSVNQTVASYEINSFAVDIDRLEMHVSYDLLDGEGANLGQGPLLTISGPDFPTAIARASEIAGADVYAALKQALYEQITASTGKTGTVA